MSLKPYLHSVCIILFTILVYVPYLGSMPLFDWDELNFAESAREMIVTGNYSRVMVNFQPFWEKPPLFFWMQTISMKLFGINEFGARFPNVIAGILTFLLIYNIGKRYYDSNFGILWALSFFSSFLPHLYFKTGIIDPFFNLFIFLGVFFLFRMNTPSENSLKEFSNGTSANTYRIKNSLIAGFFIGTAILTKGPVALLISLLCLGVYFVLERFKKVISIKEMFLFLLVSGTISLLWFGPETLKNGFWFIERFIRYQLELAGTSQAGHGQPFYYHFVVLLIGCFPISIIALFSYKVTSEENNEQKKLRVWMLILFWVVLILFSSVTTKILHYSSLCYLPMSFLSAYTIKAIWENRIAGERKIKLVLVFFGILYSIIFSAIPFIGPRLKEFSSRTKIEFVKEVLQIPIQWELYGIWIGIIFFALILFVIWNWNLGNLKTATVSLLIGTALVFEMLLFYLIPKIDILTQNAAVEFYKSIKGKDAYLEVVGFKSYGYLFYSDKQPTNHDESYNKLWLLMGKIDKPVYLVSKVGTPELAQFTEFKELYRKNGYVFLLREPKD
ncbi:MAG: glycosyltransferase family 39 protein [Leptospiraceae bacterium]|nr:glycosyltransferase family 39 protein [Leptospiraceae bacterium]